MVASIFILILINSLNINAENIESVKLIVNQIYRQLIVEGKLESNSSIIIYDASGKTVRTKYLKPKELNQTIIDLNGLSSGIYIIKLSNIYRSIHHKIILN